MIDQMVEYVTAQWPQWFNEDRPEEIVRAIMIRGTPTERRLTIFLGRPGDRHPRLVAKLGFAAADVDSITAEHLVLEEAGRALPPDIADTLPRPYAIIRSEAGVALITSLVPGRSLLLPPVAGPAIAVNRRLWRQYLRPVVTFSRRLAQTTAARESVPVARLCSTIDRFQEHFPTAGVPRRETLSFRQAVASAPGEWRPAWQHGDVAVGNVLRYRRSVRLVDWARASSHSPPWTDEAYIPSATVMLAMRQLQAPSPQEVAGIVLGKESLLGGLLREEIESAWRAPIPIGWGVALTAMEVALTVRRAGRERYGEWVDLAYGLISDSGLRRAAGSLSPQW